MSICLRLEQHQLEKHQRLMQRRLFPTCSLAEVGLSPQLQVAILSPSTLENNQRQVVVMPLALLSLELGQPLEMLLVEAALISVDQVAQLLLRHHLKAKDFLLILSKLLLQLQQLDRHLTSTLAV